LPPPSPPSGDHHRPGPPPPLSPTGRADLAVCHADLKLCLEAGTDPTSCLQTAHQCVHDALTADFKLVCAALEQACSACASSQICVDITTRCAAGVPFPDTAK
jgi:hypothetical protein